MSSDVVSSAQSRAAPGVRSRRGGRRTVFTEAVLRMIPDWVEAGASRRDIAAALGTTVASLAATCSNKSIPLRPRATWSLEQRLGRARWAELRRRAERRGVPAVELALKILMTVVDAKLIDAVLDDKEEDAA